MYTTMSCHQQYQSENVCMHFAVCRLKNGLKFDADDSLRHYKKGNLLTKNNRLDPISLQTGVCFFEYIIYTTLAL